MVNGNNVVLLKKTDYTDAEADHPIYLPLSHPLHEKLAMQDHEVFILCLPYCHLG